MAAGAVLAAGLIRQAMVEFWGATFVPFIFYFGAVTFAAWYGRLGAGVAAVFLSVAATAWSLVEADTGMLSSPPIALSLFVFTTAGVGITVALESMHRARDRAAEAEAAMKTARDEALSANRTKDAFLAMLSHELRTPLNPALILATEAAADPALPEPVRTRFDTIARQITLEARLIDDLLDLNRLTLGTLTIEPEPIDLHAVVRDAADTVLGDVTAKKMRLFLSLEAAPSDVQGDPVRLRQVFWNLLKNAVKFSPPQSAIRIESARRAEHIEVRIHDTGIGIKATDLGRVFEPFMQGEEVTERSHEYGGMGLGLAICKAILDRHGGSIRVESAGPGQGSSFTISLPAMPVPAIAKERVTPSPARPATAHPVGCRVLLVEDHGATRQAVAKLLERRGCVVVQAGSFAEAVERGAEGLFDLVISDLGLPDRDGSGLLAELRRRQPELRGIAVSGYGMEGDRERSRAGGFAFHLVKPVGIAALEDAIGRAVAQPESAGLEGQKNSPRPKAAG